MPTKDSQDSIHNGLRLPMFKAKGRPSPLSVKDLNQLVRVLNVFLNPNNETADGSKVVLSDSNWWVSNPAKQAAPAPSGGGSTKFVRLNSVQDDYLTCTDFNGNSVQVAKDPRHRNSITHELILGTHVAYTYSAGPNPLNIVRAYLDEFSVSENQMITPAWLINEVLFATTVDHTGVFVGGVELTLQMTGGNRQWMRVS